MSLLDFLDIIIITHFNTKMLNLKLFDLPATFNMLHPTLCHEFNLKQIFEFSITCNFLSLLHFHRGSGLKKFFVFPNFLKKNLICGYIQMEVNFLCSKGTWTCKAIDSFKALCFERILVGAVDCYADHVLQLFLCDTSTDENIYLHEVLLSQGHGTACRSAVSHAHMKFAF